MSTGELAILNVSEGDTKLTFDPKNKAETKRASAAVRDMIRRGFAVLIEVGHDEKGPLYRRAHDFDPETAEYIIAGAPEETEEEPASVQKPPSPPPRRPRRGKEARVRIPAAAAIGIAVAPTAGG